MIISTKNRKIKLCNEIIRMMHEYIQWNNYDTEAGGIVLGRENLGNDNLIFEFITRPMKRDIRTKTRFIRKDSEHIEFYKQLYEKHKGVYAYYGEWHTHPEDIPHYSIMDLTNWRKISKEDPKEMQYHIIVGRKQLRVWEMRKKCFLPELVCEVNWDEINFEKSYS